MLGLPGLRWAKDALQRMQGICEDGRRARSKRAEVSLLINKYELSLIP